MALEAENEVAKLRGEPPLHRTTTEDDEEDEIEAERENRRMKKKARALTAARALIDSGVDPDVVARMMLQLPGNERQVQQPAAQPTTILELAQALQILDEVRAPKNGGGGGDERIMELIKEMREEAKETRTLLFKLMTEGNGKKGESVDPVTVARNQARAMKDFGDAMIEYAKSVGYSPGGIQPNTKPSVDEIKEEHRHKEKMAEIQTEKEYKASMANALGELPERIGMGFASRVKEGDNHNPAQHEHNIEYWPCDCGFQIPIPPGASHVVCPKCQAEYNKEVANKPAPRVIKKQEGDV